MTQSINSHRVTKDRHQPSIKLLAPELFTPWLEFWCSRPAQRPSWARRRGPILRLTYQQSQNPCPIRSQGDLYMVATCQRLGSPRPLWLYLPDGPRGNEQTPRRVDRGCLEAVPRRRPWLVVRQGARALPRTYCCAPYFLGNSDTACFDSRTWRITRCPVSLSTLSVLS